MILTGPTDQSPLAGAAQHFVVGGLYRADTTPPDVHLPPLPTLTTVRVKLLSSAVSRCMAHILSSIHSAPALSSVAFTLPAGHGGGVFPHFHNSNCIEVDKWLARLTSERDRAGEGLTVVLTPWPEGNSDWEGYFPGFRRAGGELKVDAGIHSWWDSRRCAIQAMVHNLGIALGNP